MAGPTAAPHLPQPVPVDAYGKGGFAFAGMSHRGSLLCLPDGLWAWPVASPADIDAAALDPVFAAAGAVELFILGSGKDFWLMPPSLRGRFAAVGMAVEVMTTGA
ncbi:MAG TPA: MTH938/NDUFAF3 family protein, partial [Xanthobacteraceae bacterium]|nr:MTH938/NDUFAF3 family protein [Xanthobacteraceae bacterium]